MPKVRKLALIDPDLLKTLLTTSTTASLRSHVTRHEKKKRKKSKKANSKKKTSLAAGLASNKVRATVSGRAAAAAAAARAATTVPTPLASRSQALEEEMETVLGRKEGGEKNRTLYNQRLVELLAARRQQQDRNRPHTTKRYKKATLVERKENIRKKLTYDTDSQDEDEITWEHAILPKSVKARAATLLTNLRRGGRLHWNPDTHEMVIDGRTVPNTNIIDLAAHAVSQRQATMPVRGSPGPPPGFDKFAGVLRRANMPRVLLRNQRRWNEMFEKSEPSSFRDWESS